MRQRLINWPRGTTFLQKLACLDDLKYDASRTKTVYEHFYHPNDPHRVNPNGVNPNGVNPNGVNHWKERHNQFVKQYNEEKYWWMSKLENM